MFKWNEKKTFGIYKLEKIEKYQNIDMFFENDDVENGDLIKIRYVDHGRPVKFLEDAKIKKYIKKKY